MKQSFLIFFLTLGCLASYAATVSWTTGTKADGFLDPTGNKFTATSIADYMWSVNFYSDAEGKNLILSDKSGALSVFNGAVSSEAFKDLEPEKQLAAKTTYYVQAIIENDEHIRSTDILSFVTPETSGADVNFMTGKDLTNPSGGSNTWGDWTEKGGDVPEPTTCSLLLVGLAGMGLKRLRSRRRKQA